MQKYLFASESVIEGYPGKMCDQISDAISDVIIAKDPDYRVACETRSGYSWSSQRKILRIANHKLGCLL